MNTIQNCFAVLLVLTAAAAPSLAGDGCCEVQCPQCKRYTCQFEWEKVKEKHHCFCCECEPICIPAIRFPWESCCCPPKRCAKVKMVRRLTVKEYECEHCHCKWSPVECGCGNGCCGNGCCADGGCAAPGYETVPAVEPALPPAPTPAATEAAAGNPLNYYLGNAKRLLHAPIQIAPPESGSAAGGTVR